MHHISALYNPNKTNVSEVYLTAKKIELASRLKAAQLIKDTRKKMSRKLKKQSTIANEKGFKLGYESGLARANELLKEISQNKANELEQLQQTLIDLTFKITRVLIQTEIKFNRNTLINIYNNLTAEVSKDQILRVYAAPSDIAILERIMPDVCSDENLQSGDFRIELKSGHIKTDWQQHLQKIESEIKGSLHATDK